MTLTWAILLIVLGLLVLVAEVFIPSYGTLSIVAMVCIILGVTLIFFIPESEGGGTQRGLLILLVLFLLVPAVVGVSFYYWPKTRVGKQFFLPEPEEDQTLAASPEYLELEQLKGQIGKAVTPLRPAGVSLIRGHRIDTKTEGIFVDAGRWVRVLDVRMGQVTVRPLDDDEVQHLNDTITGDQ